MRPKRGMSMGPNTVENYGDDITKWFAAGAREKGRRNRLLKCAKSCYKYPGKYDVPMELHIKSLISTLHAAGSRNSTSIETDRVEGVAQRRRCGMHVRYQNGLRKVVTRNLSVKPREGRRLLMEHLGLHERTVPQNFPMEQAIRSKVSALKSALRREGV